MQQSNQAQSDSTNSSKNIIYIYFINYKIKIKTIIADHHHHHHHHHHHGIQNCFKNSSFPFFARNSMQRIVHPNDEPL